MSEMTTTPKLDMEQAESAAQRMQARRDWRAQREEDRMCEHCGFHSPLAMICEGCEAYSKGFDAGLATSTTLASTQAARIVELEAELARRRAITVGIRNELMASGGLERRSWHVQLAYDLNFACDEVDVPATTARIAESKKESAT